MLVQLLTSLFLLAIPFFFIIITAIISKAKEAKSVSNANNVFPKSYAIIGSYFTIKANRRNHMQWMTTLLQNSPTATFTLHHLFGRHQILIANPANVQHILKTHFHNYVKGPNFIDTLFDFLGDVIFNVNGETWKFQRQVASHEFNTKSLRKFVQTVVDFELHERFIPTLKMSRMVDLQDILQRFAFDNICKIAFGYDPAYLLPSLPRAEFAEAFEDATNISSERFRALSLLWRTKWFLNVGSKKRVKVAVS